MKPSIRPSTPADAPQLAELLGEVFGSGPHVPMFEPHQLHWKYWQKRDDCPGSRSFLLTQGDEILAHAGLVPGSCAWGRSGGVSCIWSTGSLARAPSERASRS